MCIYLNQGDEGLDETYILGAPVFVDPSVDGSRLQQLTVYQNNYGPSEEKGGQQQRLMILPVPSYCGQRSTEDVRLINPECGHELLPSLCQYVEELNERLSPQLDDLYQKLVSFLPCSRDLERSIGQFCSWTQPDGKLPVERVGDYLCTIVHTPDHLSPERLDTEQLGPIDSGALDFLRKHYSRDETDDEFMLAEMSEPDWKFLVCRVAPEISRPGPIAYVHSLYRIDSMNKRPDMRMLSMFLPTVHYHPSSSSSSSGATTKSTTTRAEFNHHIVALYGSPFAGVGEGVKVSMQQRDVQPFTIQPVGNLVDMLVVDSEGRKDPVEVSLVTNSTSKFMHSLQSPLAEAFSGVRWPFLQQPLDRWFQLKEEDLQAWVLEGSFPNCDFYVKLNSRLAAFAEDTSTKGN